MEPDALIAKALAGNQRALSRLATQLENRSSGYEQTLELLRPLGGSAHIIGVTGAPGAGKSSLVGSIARSLLEQGKKVAVIAVDPSSQLTGGATLGDRIRMSEIATHPNLFLRSMASRARDDGLSPEVVLTVQLFDAAGYDVVFVETVGAGQNQTEVRKIVHTVMLVEAPGAGDSVQMLKAGLMEVADIYVVNKADMSGAKLLARDLRTNLTLSSKEKSGDEFEPAVVLTSLQQPETVGAIIDELNRHREWLESHDGWNARLYRIAVSEIHQEMDRLLQASMRSILQTANQGLVAEVVEGKLQPAEVSRQLLEQTLSDSR